MNHIIGAVLTVSDRASAGEYTDTSGPLAAELLAGHGVGLSHDRAGRRGRYPARHPGRHQGGRPGGADHRRHRHRPRDVTPR